jgi:hypothetical protein
VSRRECFAFDAPGLSLFDLDAFEHEPEEDGGCEGEEGESGQQNDY